MCGIINLYGKKINNEIDGNIAGSLFTKMQYAGNEIHKEFILLLDYFSDKYLADFKWDDEGSC